MSRPRLHEFLEKVFESKDNLPLLFEHDSFREFCSEHSLSIPLKDFTLVFTHKSFSHEFNVPHQEQLEFLGDAVLQLILTEEIFLRFPLFQEGQLSKLRAAIVNETSLSTLARGLGLGELLILGKGEYQKRLFEQDVVLADTFEALLAQIYRHHGLLFTRSLFLNWLVQFLPHAFDKDFLEGFDAKSKLQERVLAKYKKLPKYESKVQGDQFFITLVVNDEAVLTGLFSSKKKGEKELAHQFLSQGHI